MRLPIFLLLLSLLSCKGEMQQSKAPDTAHNSANSVDWIGTYCGTILCADCGGIRTFLRLKQDLTYDLSQEHLDKAGKAVVQSGSFQWSETGGIISLMPWGKEGIADENRKTSETKMQFRVEEGQLRQVGEKGQLLEAAMASNYVLVKSSLDKELREKYWRLIELRGKALSGAEQLREPHLMLKITENRLVGHGGCNHFSGTYSLSPQGRIAFSMLAMTEMACMDYTLEGEFMKVLEQTDNYSLKNDTLSLNKARMAPLARFVAVYFR